MYSQARLSRQFVSRVEMYPSREDTLRRRDRERERRACETAEERVVFLYAEWGIGNMQGYALLQKQPRKEKCD